MFTHVAARMAHWPPNEAFSGSASTHSLPPESLPVLPGGAFPGRNFTDGSNVPLQGTHNNSAERALRVVALGRKNFLFCGSDSGGHRAAAIYSLIGTAKLNGVNPEAYLRFVLERIADHPSNKLDELLPWTVAALLEPHDHAKPEEN